MVSLRMVMALMLALTLFVAAAAAAQPIGPICLQPTLGGTPGQVLGIFALPVGTTRDGSQFLLSAVAARFASSGAAPVEGSVVRFTLLAADRE